MEIHGFECDSEKELNDWVNWFKSGSIVKCNWMYVWRLEAIQSMWISNYDYKWDEINNDNYLIWQ